MSDPEILVRVESDTRDAAAGLDDLGGRAGKLGGVMSAAAAGVAAAGVAVGALAVSAVQGAAQLEQSMGAVDVVFKGSADQMHTWAQGAATAAGLTATEYNNLAVVLGTQLKNGGTAITDIGVKTNELIGVGADMAAMFGGTTREAVEALASALKGERDPIERYGVSLNQAAIDAEAARLGFTKVGGALTTQGQQAATLSLIMKQTADAHGAFARESDTLAGRQAILTAQVQNLKDRLGMALLPTVTAVFGWLLNNAVPAAEKLFGALDKFRGLNLDGIATKLGFDKALPSLTQFAGVLPTAKTAVTALFDGALKPLGTFVTGTLIPTFSRIAAAVLPALAGAFNAVVPKIAPLASAIVGLAIAIGERVLPVIERMAPVVTTAIGVVADVLGHAADVVRELVQTVTAIINGDWSAAWDHAKQLVSAAWDLIVSILRGAWDLIVSIFRTAIDQAKALFGGLWDDAKARATAGVEAVKGFVSGMWSSITGFFADGYQAATANLSEFWSSITGAFSTGADTVKNTAADLWTAVTGFFSDGYAAVTGWVADLWATVSSAFSTGVSTVVGYVSQWVTDVVAQASELYSSVTGWVADLWATVSSAFSTGVSTVVGYVTTLPTLILSALSGLGSLLIGAGADLISGLISGITGSLQRLISALWDTVQRAMGWLKDKLGISSPSEYMRHVFGQNMGQGIAEGMLDKRRELRDATEKTLRYGLDVTPPKLPTELDPRRDRRGGRTGDSGRGSTRIDIRVDGLVTDPLGTGRAIRKALDGLDRVVGAAA